MRTYDQDVNKAKVFAEQVRDEAAIEAAPVEDLSAAVAASDIVITCTTARRYFIDRDMVRPGTFVAGVGADNENKQELEPLLLAESTVVADLIEQCATIGDLHHAIDASVMSRADVHAELGQVIAGLKRGRAAESEVIIFDSTGTALQDVAAAVAVYRHASQSGTAPRFSFNE